MVSPPPRDRATKERSARFACGQMDDDDIGLRGAGHPIPETRVPDAFDRALIGAHGTALALVAAYLKRAGIVDMVGEEVPTSLLHQRVWLYNGQRGRAFGTAAEYITLAADLVAPLPEQTSFAEGACLGIPGMTAHRCVFADGLVTEQTVLVTGGAGAVGHYAIQLAKWGGARVITTVSSPLKADHARAAGQGLKQHIGRSFPQGWQGDEVRRVHVAEWIGGWCFEPDVLRNAESIGGGTQR